MILAGLVLLAWALLADARRTRRPRRAGVLRRCPRCWYDMAQVPGLTCPECGRTVSRERALRRPRRRWRLALAASAFTGLGLCLAAVQHGRGTGWSRRLPDTLTLALVPFTIDGWALEEVARRLRVGSRLPGVEVPHPPVPWQWTLLRRACRGDIQRAGAQADLAWGVVAGAPFSGAAADLAIRMLPGRADDSAPALRPGVCGAAPFTSLAVRLSGIDTARRKPTFQPIAHAAADEDF